MGILPDLTSHYDAPGLTASPHKKDTGGRLQEPEGAAAAGRTAGSRAAMGPGRTADSRAARVAGLRTRKAAGRRTRKALDQREVGRSQPGERSWRHRGFKFQERGNSNLRGFRPNVALRGRANAPAAPLVAEAEAEGPASEREQRREALVRRGRPRRGRPTHLLHGWNLVIVNPKPTCWYTWGGPPGPRPLNRASRSILPAARTGVAILCLPASSMSAHRATVGLSRRD